jgi:hypothetical protein
MKLYWRARDIPELSTLREPNLRVAFHACVIPVWRRHIWLATLLVPLFVMCGWAAGVLVSQHRWGWASFAGAGLGGLAAAQVFIQVVFERSRPKIKRYLEGLRDV